MPQSQLSQLMLLVILLSGGMIISADASISIDTIETLQKIGNDPAYPLDGGYVLTQDIDASVTATWNGGAGFTPIGCTMPTDAFFTGTFDGQGHVIRNITINLPSRAFVGLFGSISGAEIENVGLSGGVVTGGETTGGLVGRMISWSTCEIRKCYTSCSVVGSNGCVGGLIGQNGGDVGAHSVVTDCYSTGSVSGTSTADWVGGLVGANGTGGSGYYSIVNSWSTGAVSCANVSNNWCGGGLIGANYGYVSQCYATGDVSGTSRIGALGGLLGQSGGVVTNCYARGAVSGGYWTGGLIGAFYTMSGPEVTNCYATGMVSNGYQMIGGLMGQGNYPYRVYSSFWDVLTSGQTWSFGGTGETTAAMKSQSTFVNWDFTSVWNIIEGQTYPFLRSLSSDFQWVLINPAALWPARGGHTAAAMNNKLWVLGGWGTVGDRRNDVWWTADGTNWTQATGSAAWTRRYAHTTEVFQNKLWVMGGDIPGAYMNDVWSSPDGANWTQATSNAGWPKREHLRSVVFNDKLWIMGGQQIWTQPYAWYNDVWWSADGTSWTQATANAPWSGRSGHATAVFDNKIWVLGGGSNGTTFKNDVWWSSDGVTWTQATPNAAWTPRTSHVAAVFDNKLWVMGGGDASQDFSDMWSSEDGANWIQATPHAEWTARHLMTVTAFSNKLWLLGGDNSSGHLNDVWSSSDLSGPSNYSYDTDNRLTQCRLGRGVQITYQYDPAGNRLQKTVSSPLTISVASGNPPAGGMQNSGTNRPVLETACQAAATEGVTVNSVTFTASGTGNDTSAISAVKLWNDANGNGVVDSGESQVGSNATFSADNGTVTFLNLAFAISAGQTANLLLTYDLNGTAQQGQTFSARLTDNASLVADGSVSGPNIAVLGAPVNGVTLTISTDTNPPTFAGLAAATGQDSQISLAWATATDPSTPITYDIWQTTASFGGVVSGPPSYTTQGAAYTVPNLVNGQEYFFVVRARDAAGNRDANAIEQSSVPQATLYTLTLTASPNGCVSIPTGATPFERNTQISLAATGDAGYHFTNWTGDVPSGADVVSPLMLVMDGDKALTANFVRSTGTVGVNATPSAAPWSFVDGDGIAHTGPAPVLNVPTGDIQVTWLPLAGYLPPAQPAPQTLSMDGYVTFTGVYAPVLAAGAPMQNQRHYIGETAQFTVQTSGGLGSLHYQWKFDDHHSGVVGVGGDSPTLTLANVPIANAGDYWCVVTDAASQVLTSSAATLAVADHLSLAGTLPLQAKKYAGQSHSLAVTTLGGFDPKVYHWTKNSQPTGTSTAELQIPSLSTGDTGSYTCQVTDDLGSSVTTSASSLVVAEALSFEQNLPTEAKKYIGQGQTFQVAMQGGFDPKTYHWFKDNQPIGSNSADMSIPSVSQGDQGAYFCQINDSYTAVVWSNTATLNVADHLSFTTALPAQVNKHFGENGTLQVVVSGGFQPLAYEWYKNGAKIVGADTSDLNLQDLAQGDAGTYEVQVTDGNSDVRQSSTELVLTWGMPAVGSVGLLLLVGIGLIGGSLMTKRRHHANR